MQKLGAHVAAIGFTFYTGNMFPASYKNAAIIAQHGSWNRSTPSGYRVMAAHTDGRRVTGYEPLVEGFLPATAGGWTRCDRGGHRPTGGRAADARRLDPDQRRPRQSPDPRQLRVGSSYDIAAIGDMPCTTFTRPSVASSSPLSRSRHSRRSLRAQTRTEITINDTGVQAENLTSSQDGTVYFGSTAKGTIYRAAPGAAQAEPWIQASTAGLTQRARRARG